MINVHWVYIQAGYSGRDHLAPLPEVTRERFPSRSAAMDYYTRRYPGWAIAIVYARSARGGGVERVQYGPRTDGRVHEGVMVERILA